MHTVSLIFGILSLIGLVIAFFPCLGSLNWINIPFAVVGLIISILTIAVSDDKESKGGLIGVILCGLAVGIGMVRLMIGGGIV